MTKKPHSRNLIEPGILAGLLSDLPDGQAAEVVADLLNEIDSQLDQMRDFTDLKSLRSHAHHLTGLAATVGAADLAESAAAFEATIAAGGKVEIAPLIALAQQSRIIIESVMRGES